MANFVRRKAVRESTEHVGEFHEIFGGIFGDIFGNKNGIEFPEMTPQALMTSLHESDSLSEDGEILNDDILRSEQALEKVSDENASDITLSALQVAQENIRKRWALSGPKVARESFRRGGNRSLARESWKDTIKALWERFIELCIKIRDKAKDIWYNFTNEGKRIFNRTTKMLQRLQNLDKLSDGAEFDNVPTYVRKTLILNTFMPMEAASLLDKMMGNGFNSTVKAFREVADKTASFIGLERGKTQFGYDFFFTDDDSPMEVRAAGAFCNEVKRNLPSISAAMSNTMMEHFGYSQVTALTPLPGNGILMAGSRRFTSGVSSEKAIRAIGLVRYTTVEMDEPTIKVPVMGLRDLREIIGDVQRAATKYEKFIKDFRVYDAELEKLQNAAKKATKIGDAAVDADEKGEGKAELNFTAMFARLQLTTFEHLNRAIVKTVSQTSHGLLDYCQACMRMYKPKKA